MHHIVWAGILVSVARWRPQSRWLSGTWQQWWCDLVLSAWALQVLWHYCAPLSHSMAHFGALIGLWVFALSDCYDWCVLRRWQIIWALWLLCAGLLPPLTHLATWWSIGAMMGLLALLSWLHPRQLGMADQWVIVWSSWWLGWSGGLLVILCACLLALPFAWCRPTPLPFMPFLLFGVLCAHLWAFAV